MAHNKLTNILFLDVDGPLIPLRLHVQTNGLMAYDYHPTGTKVWDIDFVKYLNDTLPLYNYQIVFNTAHNDFGIDYMWNHAVDNGLIIDLLHLDFITGYPTHFYDRMHAINDWLVKHDCDNWIVVDDVFIADGINHVRPPLSMGMTKPMIVQLDNLLAKNLWPK